MGLPGVGWGALGGSEGVMMGSAPMGAGKRALGDMLGVQKAHRDLNADRLQRVVAGSDRRFALIRAESTPMPSRAARSRYVSNSKSGMTGSLRRALCGGAGASARGPPMTLSARPINAHRDAEGSPSGVGRRADRLLGQRFPSITGSMPGNAIWAPGSPSPWGSASSGG